MLASNTATSIETGASTPNKGNTLLRNVRQMALRSGLSSPRATAGRLRPRAVASVRNVTVLPSRNTIAPM